MHQQIHCGGAPSGFVHLLRRKRRVLVDPRELIAQIAIGQMLQFTAQLPWPPAVECHRFVHIPAAPPRRAPVIEPGLIIRVEVGGPDPSAQMKRHARHAVRTDGRIGPQQRLNLGRQFGRDPFIRIQRKYPVVRRQAGGKVLLVDPAGPVAMFDARAFCAGNRCRPIITAAVDDDDVVGPGGAVDRRRDVVRFVESNDRDGDSRQRRNLRLVSARIVNHVARVVRARAQTTSSR